MSASSSGPLPPNTPILVGVGLADQRVDDHLTALEPIELMIDAVRSAAADSGSGELLLRVGSIAVPHGRWSYGDPGRTIATRLGVPDACTVLAEVGVLQQTIIGDACQRIASGELQATLVVGGEAGHRLRRAAAAGVAATETVDPAEPDVTLRPQHELISPVELAAGLNRALGYYAIIESAFRARQGWSVDEGRRRISSMYSQFSHVAADNPRAWRRTTADPELIMVPTEKNPMMAFPYTRSHISSWSVDQAGALLFCSVGTARELGIPSDRWIFPVVSAESNDMVSVCNRADLGRTVGVEVAVHAALDRANFAPADLDHVDLYSCFPVAVEMFAEALGYDVGSRDFTITGGMPWAGGPFNNYVIQATAMMAEKLRVEQRPTHGMVTCVSGLLTKIGVAIWSNDHPSTPFASLDVTDDVAATSRTVDIVGDYSGRARVAGYTVLHERRGTRGVLVLDVPGARTVAWTDDPELIASMERDEWIGREVVVEASCVVS